MLSIDLSGHRALVTGVSSGIGLGIAKALAQAGCDVAGCGSRDASDEGARRFVSEVEAQEQRARYDSVDLRDPAAPRRWVELASESLGGVDIVVSNAGRNVFAGAEKCTEEDWRECMELDLASHWRLAQAAKVPLMHGRDPVILIIGSNHAYATIGGCFPYNVAKAGLVALVQSLAIEWGPAIRSVGVAPGFIDTPGNDMWFNTFPDPAAERQRTVRLHPVGRIGSVDEIGRICAFLASSYAGFISGTTLLADGGRSALMQDS